MKNTLKAFATVAIASLTILSNANAQTAIGKSNFGVNTSTIDDGGKNNDASNTINARALKNFQKTFNKVSNADWSKTLDGGYVAHFTEDDVKTVVAYNGKGNWNYTIRYYHDKKLPFDIRAMVKRSYCDYTISLITEVNFNLQTVYLVYLQNETHLKTIRIYDGEMEEAASYIKG